MYFTLTRLLVAVSFLGPAASLMFAGDKKAPEVNSVRLYLPDDQLRDRLGSDVKPLANYIRALEKAANTYWEQSPEPEAKGLLIAVGIKPGRYSRVWCEAVEGDIPAPALEKLEKLLAEVPAIDVHQAPMAFAIELRLGGHNVRKFPEFPAAWSKAAEDSKRPATIPDELFKIIWPD